VGRAFLELLLHGFEYFCRRDGFFHRSMRPQELGCIKIVTFF
jgi:hypothetical protein